MSTENERFVKSYPSFIDSAIWQDDGLFKLYHYCLYKASRNSYLWRHRMIQPGEIPVSRRNTSKELGWSKDKLNQKLTALEKAGFISVEIASRGTLIRINHWLGFQSSITPETNAECAENQHGGMTETELVCTNFPHSQDAERAENQHTRPFCVPETGTLSAPTVRETRPNLDNRENSQTHRPPIEEPVEFLALWLRYPPDRRNRRSEAAFLFSTALKEGATLDSMMEALNADLASSDWLKDNGRYIPGITKWLQRERWRDFAQKHETREDGLWTTTW